MISAPLTLFRCLRHRRGFGIHSPFAYAFVTEVLAQRLPYYGYADISHDARIRLLFRLIVYFQPEKAAVFSSQPDLLRRAIIRASSKTHITDANTSQCPVAAMNSGLTSADFVVADADDYEPETYISLITDGANAIILNAVPDSRRAIASALPHGMIFDNRRGTLVVASLSHLPRQDFDVWF